VPRRRWLGKVRRASSLSIAWRFMLERGEFPPDELLDESDDKVELFRAWHSPAAKPVWHDHGDQILADWILEHPGTRPWAWWTFDAAEPRHVVTGSELLLPKDAPTDWEWCWRQRFGVQAFQHFRPREAPSPLVESEPGYLRRLALLTAEERAGLEEEAFQPEEYTLAARGESGVTQ
jgi:hypothetical protein